MEEITVNLSSFKGKILNVFLLGLKPDSTCEAFWALCISIIMWCSVSLVLFGIPISISGLIYHYQVTGSIEGFGDSLLNNLPEIWPYNFERPFSNTVLSIVSLFSGFLVMVFAAASIAIPVVYLLKVIIPRLVNLKVKLPREKLRRSLLVQVIKDTFNKVCRPIKWKYLD